MRNHRALLVSIGSIALCCDMAAAQPGLDFVTVGAAGNRAALPSERPNALDPGAQYGAVNYEFRITRTEIRNEEWFEFLNAYRPFVQGNSADIGLRSLFVSDNGTSYQMLPGTERFPVLPSWSNAARYCNWLHNGRVSETWAFESGAYDTMTFTMNPDGSRNDQLIRSPGARYWIPNYDEAFKAFYYDPDRYGSGLDGYWLYPQSSNTPTVSGAPGMGTTNGGLGVGGPFGAAGSYPSLTSPWGLLDASGGAVEWTETAETFARRRVTIGSGREILPELVAWYDRADWGPFYIPPDALNGFRVASEVPAVMTIAPGLVFAIALISKRRSR